MTIDDLTRFIADNGLPGDMRLWAIHDGYETDDVGAFVYDGQLWIDADGPGMHLFDPRWP